jgi:hypothetical protein
MKSTRSNKETTLCENDIKTTYLDKTTKSFENINNIINQLLKNPPLLLVLSMILKICTTCWMEVLIPMVENWQRCVGNW